MDIFANFFVVHDKFSIGIVEFQAKESKSILFSLKLFFGKDLSS